MTPRRRPSTELATRFAHPVVGIALVFVFVITSALGLGVVPLVVAGAAVLVWTVAFARRLSVRDEIARR